MQMICAWKELLDIIPARFVQDVDTIGRDALTELRLRFGSPAELVMGTRSVRIGSRILREDLECCVNFASRYSPWAAITAAKGYLTAKGGHRIGMCGEAVIKNGTIFGIKNLSSLCIRVARDYPGIGERIGPLTGSALIIGSPGCGKTTLLRDLARQLSKQHTVCVVDERGELFPDGFHTGLRTDILRGCRKAEGIQQALRTMGPGCIALDEVTAQEDCSALVRAVGCGVQLLATAHAGSLDEFLRHPVYKPLADKKVFQWILMLGPDKRYTTERMSE